MSFVFRRRWVQLLCVMTVLGLSGTAVAQEAGAQVGASEEAESLHPLQGWKSRFFAGASFIGRRASKDNSSSTVTYGYQLLYRWSGFDLGVILEHSMWPESEFQTGNKTPSVFNWGVDAGMLYFKDGVRSSIALGGSTMLFATFFEEFGTSGPFMTIRPVSLRIPARLGVLEVTPLGLTVMIPSTTYIPLVKVAFQTSVGFEWSL